MAEIDTLYQREQDMGVHSGSPKDAQVEHNGIGNGHEQPPKKRRRVVKPNPEKKFECNHEGCGKSYSRAEHLYRHQLNRELSPTANSPV